MWTEKKNTVPLLSSYTFGNLLIGFLLNYYHKQANTYFTKTQNTTKRWIVLLEKCVFSIYFISIHLYSSFTKMCIRFQLERNVRIGQLNYIFWMPNMLCFQDFGLFKYMQVFYFEVFTRIRRNVQGILLSGRKQPLFRRLFQSERKTYFYSHFYKSMIHHHTVKSEW